jgi:hypothetical protein
MHAAYRKRRFHMTQVSPRGYGWVPTTLRAELLAAAKARKHAYDAAIIQASRRKAAAKAKRMEAIVDEVGWIAAPRMWDEAKRRLRDL